MQFSWCEFIVRLENHNLNKKYKTENENFDYLNGSLCPVYGAI